MITMPLLWFGMEAAPLRAIPATACGAPSNNRLALGRRNSGSIG